MYTLKLLPGDHADRRWNLLRPRPRPMREHLAEWGMIRRRVLLFALTQHLLDSEAQALVDDLLRRSRLAASRHDRFQALMVAHDSRPLPRHVDEPAQRLPRRRGLLTCHGQPV